MHVKVGILTWSKVVNHGAVLQAYATQQNLISLGCYPVMLDYNGNKNGMRMSLQYRLKNVANKLSFSALRVRKKLPEWNNTKAALFQKFRLKQFVCGLSYRDEPNLDAVLIGSDMVFDFFEGYNPFMYGKDVNAPYIFAYAACFGYVNPKMLDEYEHKHEIVSHLKKMDGIGYRDDNTNAVLKQCCDINTAVKNIDPVLLYGFTKEKQMWNTGKWQEKKYILVYAYTYNMDKPGEVAAIKKLAREMNLKVVSVGYMHEWCDEVVNAGPEEFLEMFVNATFVVTDTFHGTVFSIICEKQFCTIVRNNAFKVIDLLKDVGLEYLLELSYRQRLLSLPESPINYHEVNSRLNKLRESSWRYIEYHVKEGATRSDQK